jgi:hypothetical protein
MKLPIHGAAILLTLNFAAMLSSQQVPPQRKTDPPSKSYVHRIDLGFLAERFRALPDRSQALIRRYLQGAQRYVLTREDGAFPEKGSEHWRNIAERAHGAAVLAAFADRWPDELRERCRRQSVEFVREFVAQFEKDHSLGNNWQSSWWAAEMGTAAWFLWDRLDPALQQGVADMVVYHADHIAGQKPGARINLDTEAETVAWNSTILSLAANMMPQHPHSAKWRDAIRQYVYTIFGTPHDLQDGTPGDEGKPVKDWVVGANIHDDFSLENHNRFHMDYELTCYRFLMYGAAMHRLGGNPVPAAFRHHAWDVYEKVLLQCLNGSKFAVYVSDNDWKRYHDWTESAAVHGYLALLESSPLASALEEQSLKEADSYWREFPANFSYANPYVCGKAWTPRIADIVLMHLLLPPPPEPISATEAEARLQGARQKHDVNLLTHYSRAGSFRSFYWGPGPTVRHIEPKDNAWMLLPLTIDYGIAIDGKPGPDAGAKVFCRTGGDWFWALRRDNRGVRDAFISLPDEIVVVMAAAPAAATKGAGRVDSLVSVEKPHKTFTVFYQQGQATFHYGQKAWDRSDKVGGLALRTPWVNLADSIGYVAINLSADPSGMVLPKPGVRGALSLHHIDKPGQDHYFITVAFPNQDHHSTETMAAKVTGTFHNGIMTCRVPPYFVWANFSDQAGRVQLPQGVEAAGPVTSPPASVGILRMGHNGRTWSPLH